MSNTALASTAEMASLGFIAVSFAYPNQTDTSCFTLQSKDACMILNLDESLVGYRRGLPNRERGLLADCGGRRFAGFPARRDVGQL
jgi:hypothetical protein